MQKMPLSLYVHTPWCVQKCPYCDFNSHRATEILPEDKFLEQLASDLQADIKIAQHTEIKSIFFGGGTPSLLSGSFVDRLMGRIRSTVHLTSGAEITLESNPGASDVSRFFSYFNSGVNRLSIGVQSFDDSLLKRIGRIHSSSEAFQAFEYARDAGFKRINLDLMFGLPGQSVAQALSDLKQAIALNPEHISWYQLTLEKNTAFYRDPPRLPEEDEIWQMYCEGQKLLADAGYQQYEVSAYAKPGEQSQHNLNYWQFGDYLGIGPGAHGKLTQQSGEIIRTRKIRTPNHYLSAIDPCFERNSISEDELVFEFMLNALRLKEGVPWLILELHAGIKQESIQMKWQELVKKDLLQADRCATTALGYQYLDQVISEFLE